jgi:hypothetical protein
MPENHKSVLYFNRKEGLHMNTLKKIYSAAVVCLLSFKKRLPLQRILCVICILAILFPGFSLTVTAITGNDALSNKSIELNLNTEEADSKVTLNGMMPHNAVANVTDVTGDYADEGGLFETTSVIAAYDITITHGGTEYQPGTGCGAVLGGLFRLL